MNTRDIEKLYNDLWKKLVGYASNILGRQYRRDAEEVVQEAFLKMLQWAEKGREIREPVAWIYKVVKNEAIKLKELGTNWDLIGTDYIDKLHNKYDEGCHANDEYLQDLLDKIATLGKREQEAIRMCWQDGWTTREAGKALGIDHSTVVRILSKAKEKLK